MPVIRYWCVNTSNVFHLSVEYILPYRFTTILRLDQILQSERTDVHILIPTERYPKVDLDKVVATFNSFSSTFKKEFGIETCAFINDSKCFLDFPTPKSTEDVKRYANVWWLIQVLSKRAMAVGLGCSLDDLTTQNIHQLCGDVHVRIFDSEDDGEFIDQLLNLTNVIFVCELTENDTGYLDMITGTLENQLGLIPKRNITVDVGGSVMIDNHSYEFVTSSGGESSTRFIYEFAFYKPTTSSSPNDTLITNILNTFSRLVMEGFPITYVQFFKPTETRPCFWKPGT